MIMVHFAENESLKGIQVRKDSLEDGKQRLSSIISDSKKEM